MNGKGTVLFQPISGPGGIAVYTVDQTTGLLTAQPSSFIPFTLGAPPIAAAGAGDLLFGLDFLRRTINGFHVTDGGVVSATAQGSAPVPTNINVESPYLQVVTVKQ